jgi:hypothetical protein
MLPTPQKTSQPPKYASKEEKAREDAIKRRERRRVQSTRAQRDIRFKHYLTEEAPAIIPSLIS